VGLSTTGTKIKQPPYFAAMKHLKSISVSFCFCEIPRELEKDWTSICLKELTRERLISLKRTQQHCLGLQRCVWINRKTSETYSSGQTRPKWRCLDIMHSSMFRENQTQQIFTITSYQILSTLVEVWLFELVLLPQDMDHDLWITKYSRVKCEAICLIAKAGLKDLRCSNGPVKVRIWTKVKWWWDLIRAVHTQILQTLMIWSNIVKKGGPKFIHNDVKDW